MSQQTQITTFLQAQSTPVPAMVWGHDGRPGFICMEALRALSSGHFNTNTVHRAVARLRRRDAEFAAHCFLARGVDGTRHPRLLVDLDGLEMLLTKLPERIVGPQRRRAIRMMRHVFEGDAAIAQQVIANNESARDLAGISIAAAYKLARHGFNDALKACLEAAPTLRKQPQFYYGMFARMLQGAVVGKVVPAADLNEAQRVTLTHAYHEATDALRGAMEAGEKGDGWMKVVEDRVHAVATKAKRSRPASLPAAVHEHADAQ